MAISGRDPKTVKHGRNPLTSDWNDVADRPYDGPSPDLPKLPRRQKWREPAVEWWNEVRVMPHCVMWAATDWRFALETAQMKQQFWLELEDGELKTTLATEIRRREDQMGTTGEARRKLRIRYVDPELLADPDEDDVAAPAAGETQVGDGTVTDLTARRRRLSA